MIDTELIAKIHALLDSLAGADRFSGAVLLARGNQVLLNTARGYAIHPNVLLNQPDTKFDTASVTKMFTAVAAMQLVAAGKLDLHAPVAAYAPDLPYASQITAHQLLTHTAGFGHYWNDAYRAVRSDLRTVNDYVRLVARLPLEHPPGTRHLYSNSGYVVLGALIEQVTGESYYDTLQRSIYQPAGMQNTGHFELDLPVANRAIGYTNENWHGPVDGQRRSNYFIYAVKGDPSGGCYSTVQDLFCFFQALLDHRLIDAGQLEQCFTPQAAGEQPGVSYSYGFHIIDDARHGRVIGHGGRHIGGDAFAVMYRDLGYTLVVLSNYDRPAARNVMNAIADMLIT